MKEKLLQVFNKFYHVKDKIAFFPSIIAFAGCLFAYVMMYAESKGISSYLIDFFPELVINDTETARTILATFIAGLISIMVFSFSMVMILLNQASSNFSPRLLPGLISNRRHQIVLGIYIATILYCIFILVFIEPTGKEYQLPGFSVLIAIVFMVISLAAFIYFIHSISQEIQINNIMHEIFLTSEKKLKKELKLDAKNNIDFPNSDHWEVFPSKSFGYLQNVSTEILSDIAFDADIFIDIIAKQGTYIHKDSDLFKLNKKVDKDCLDKIYATFNISFKELIEENYLSAFKHLTEIGLKAMSPGINDPGTTIYSIDYLSNLLLLKEKKSDYRIITKKNKPTVKIIFITFEEVLHTAMLSLRTYCKNDAVVMKKLLAVLKHLLKVTENEAHKKIISVEISNLLTDAKSAITNKLDYESLENFSENF